MTEPRLLFVVNDPKFFMSHRRKLAEGARLAGYDVHVAAPRSDGWDALGDAGFQAHAIELNRRSLNPLGAIRTVRSLFRLYRRLQPDLVHHITIKAIVYGGIAARMARVPSVINAVTGLGWAFTEETPLTRAVRRVACVGYRQSFRHPRMTAIFQNDDDRQTFLRLGLLREDATALIRGSGVDTERFIPHPLPSDGSPPLVVFPGRLLRDKGAATFVEAARIIQDRGHKARFALVGGLDPGNRSGVAEAAVREWVSTGCVEWWGHRTDMPEVYRQARIVCLPSRREGVPLALLEAAACGRPIVTTDAPGCRDVIEHGGSGILVPVDDATALADALQTLLVDVELCQTMGEAGRARVEQLFSSDHIVGDTLTEYQRLLSQSTNGANASEQPEPKQPVATISLRGT